MESTSEHHQPQPRTTNEPIPDQHQVVANEGFHPSIKQIIDALDEQWVLNLQPDHSSLGVRCELAKQPGPSYVLEDTDSKISITSSKNNSSSAPDVFSSPSFEQTFAALIERVDWGAFPTEKPSIWEYTGYKLTNGKFDEYLKTVAETSQSDHELINTHADYRITLNTRFTPSSKTTSPKTIVNIEYVPETESPVQLYHRSFSGQQHAFNTLFNLLDIGLSKHIYSASIEPDSPEFISF